ncbi:hypothetical protein Pmani_026348 [Petrolisthes manimaculis]|uniref:Uncharacterized protein n=1 Tax=Petrolisthes manimaculis TaxID=1843537 RepID=A0AAE1P6C1_9EUCA|nr:hypothetical protein Pmani_026348 [Petrolisthes manimaculis]
MTSSYRSSLISHLVVQGKSPVINSVKELVGRDEWRWGTQRMTGAIKPYLKSSPNPDMRKLYYQMQIKSIEEGMTLVLGGGFAFVHTNYLNMQILVAAYYTDKIGYTPIHISTSKYPLFSGNSFGIRPGAPFLRRFRLTRQRLLEGGLMSFWTYDVMNTRKRQLRQEQLSNKQSSEIPNIIQAGGGQVVLGFQHLLGAFVVLALGSILACLSFVTETFGCFN